MTYISRTWKVWRPISRQLGSTWKVWRPISRQLGSTWKVWRPIKTIGQYLELEHVKVILRIIDSGTFFTARPANFTGIQSL